MLMIKALLLGFVTAASASCGTHCGGCTAKCVNNPSLTCTDCGYNPCVDVNNYCWSCFAVNGNCYPYDCGDHCSTTSCSSIEATANSVPKMTVENKPNFAKAARTDEQLATPVGARTSKAMMLEIEAQA